MRILHCLRAPIGGLFRHVLDLAGEQARRGHDVGLLTDSTVQNALTSVQFAEIAPLLTLGVARIPISRQPGLGDYKAARATLDHARPLNLDVLHGHGAKGGAYARLARRALRAQGQPVQAFYTPHGGTLNYRPGTAQSTVLLSLERVLERFTDGLIFESAYAARVYCDRVGNGPAPQRVIHNGLRPGDFMAHTPEPDATDFLFIGELRPIKGMDHMLDALAQLNERSPVTATIVGSGPEEAKLKAKTAELGLQDRLRFTGALPARTALSLGRTMVVPSLAESFPYVVLEAAAAGVPLISTDVGGIPEITTGTDSELIPPASVPALVKAMRECLDHPEAAAQRAQRLKDNVASKFTVSAMADAVLAFYALRDA
ncbi:MAG: glycosyltransferase family 4 protein [Hyphomicrobiaceae bacterium]